MNGSDASASRADGSATSCPAEHAVDLDHSYRTLERAMSTATALNHTQKENVRLKAEDLRRRQLVWESVPFRVLFEFNR